MSNFPFPQLWLGQEYFKLEKDSITLLSKDFWVDQENMLECEQGQSWHVADFGAFYVFANGTSVVVYDLWNGFSSFLSYQSERFVFSTCCVFNGQLFVGGICPFVDEDEESQLSSAWASAGVDSVGWSKIGQFDFTIDKSNLAGHRSMGLGGVVLRVLQLGKMVIAYNSNGVQAYYPTSEPVVGFGMQQLALPGCAGRSAVGGNQHEHVMIDTTGQLWYIRNQSEPELLGYQEFFRPMLGKDIVVTYNDLWKAFDITDGEAAYRLTRHGLCRVWQAVTSQFMAIDGVIGTYHAIDGLGFELVSDVLDFGFRGHKTITGIEVGGSFSAPVFVAVDWRSHNEKYFRSTPWVRLSPAGTARPRVTADEFRIKIQSASKDLVELDYINIKYQITDKRNARGSINVDSVNTRANSE